MWFLSAKFHASIASDTKMEEGFEECVCVWRKADMKGTGPSGGSAAAKGRKITITSEGNCSFLPTPLLGFRVQFLVISISIIFPLQSLRALLITYRGPFLRTLLKELIRRCVYFLSFFIFYSSPGTILHENNDSRFPDALSRAETPYSNPVTLNTPYNSERTSSPLCLRELVLV